MAEHKFNLIEMSMPSLMCLFAGWFWLFDYREMSREYQSLSIAPPYLWGAMFFLVGIFKGYAIIYDRVMIRQTAALVGLVLWLAIGTLFLSGDYRSLLGIVCLFLSVQSFLSWFRIAPHRK